MPYQIGQTISADEFKKAYPVGQTISANQFNELRTQMDMATKRQEPGFGEKSGEVGIGFGKKLLQRVAQVGTFGQKALQKISKDTFGVESNTPTLNDTLQGSKYITPTNKQQELGGNIEQVAEFFVPAATGTKAVKIAGATGKFATGIRLATEAAGVAGVTKAQGGNTKDITENLALSAGAGLVGKALGTIADKVAPRVINSLIKPLSKDFEFGKNPGLGVVREKITANSFDDLISKLGTRKSTVGQEIRKVLQSPEVSQYTVSIPKALAPVDDALKAATDTGDQQLVTALLDFRNSIVNKYQLVDDKLVQVGTKALKVTPEEALAVKGNVSNSVRWREGIDKELNKVKIKVYQNLRGQIEDAVTTARKTNKTIPDINPLNERYANLATAESAAKYRNAIVKRLNLTTIGGLGIGGLSQAQQIGQNLKEGDIEGLAGNLLTVGLFGLGGKAASSVAVKTRAANAIAKLSPEQRSVVTQAIPLLRSILQSANQ